jgi:ion channel-forming bestrophin family protein
MGSARIKNVKKSLESSMFYLLISKPNYYFKRLIYKTLLIGVITFLLTLTLHWVGLDDFIIPPSMHSLIGFVIGLLLVFRNNTAYERWWEGRKIISSVSYDTGLISATLNSIKNTSNEPSVEEVKKVILGFIITLKNYLKLGDNGKESALFHSSQKKSIEKGFKILDRSCFDDNKLYGIHISLGRLLEHSNSLERIKNTPIPLSYVLHIKISILFYLITLPFGLFHDLGVLSTFMVMVAFYIMAGVEIISNEIENPFAGDPNDIPIDKLFGTIEENI